MLFLWQLPLHQQFLCFLDILYGLLFAHSQFDSVKTRMQVTEYKSTWDCIRRTYSSEGIYGFYRGITPVLFTVSFFRSLSFSIYSSVKSGLTADQKSRSMGQLIKTTVISGATAGLVIPTLAAPIEFVKIHRQLEVLNARLTGAVSTRSTVDWIRHIYALKGLSGFYIGYRLHLFRDTLGTAVYFTVYESVKRFVGSRLGSDVTPPWLQMLGGGLAGSIVWIVMFPIDM